MKIHMVIHEDKKRVALTLDRKLIDEFNQLLGSMDLGQGVLSEFVAESLPDWIQLIRNCESDREYHRRNNEKKLRKICKDRLK